MISKLSHRPRSIVFLGTAHDNGGTSILASNLARAMRTRGHHVEEWYLFGSDGDMPVGSRVFEPTQRSHSPLVLTALFFRLVATLRKRKPDVLFGLQPYSNVLVGAAGRIAGVRNRVPTYHGPRAFVTPSLMVLDNIVHWLGLYTQMVGCANSVVETYRRNDMAVVVNGHDVPQVFSRAEARAALGLPADGLILGQIGRLSHQKNQSFSLDLLQRLPEATLVLLGIGPDEASLRSQIEAAGLTAKGPHRSRDCARPHRAVLFGHRSGAVSVALRRIEPRGHRSDPCRRAAAMHRYRFVPRNVRRLDAAERATLATGG